MRDLTILEQDTVLTHYYRAKFPEALASLDRWVHSVAQYDDTIGLRDRLMPDTVAGDFHPTWAIWKELPDSATVLARWGVGLFQEFLTLTRDGERMTGEGFSYHRGVGGYFAPYFNATAVLRACPNSGDQ